MKTSPITNEDVDVVEERKNTTTKDPKKVAVKVQNIRKVFKIGLSGYKVAVNDVSFTIPEGECFALLGINGAGKTTTFKMLTGDVNPTQGKAFVRGYAIPKEM